MKKSNSRWGGVDECIFGVPTLHGDHKKKRSPCSMGRPKPRIATPPERERRFLQIIRFLLLWILVDFGSANWHPRGEFKRKLENHKKKHICFFDLLRALPRETILFEAKTNANNKRTNLACQGFVSTERKFI